MDRTFHHRFTLGAACGIILLLVLAVYSFWIKSPILGCLMSLGLILIAERSLHKKYIFSGDKLIIYNGRLAKTKTISLSQINSCKPMTNVFGLVRFLVIFYDDNKKVESVQPDNESAFVECLKKRKNEYNR